MSTAQNRLFATVFAAIALAGTTNAQQPPNLTVGLLRNDPGSFDGYTLFSPNPSRTTYLIDHWGREVHRWMSDVRPGLSAYLLDDGSLLRTGSLGGNPRFSGGGAAGRLDRYDWDGTLQWRFEYSTDQYLSHHDVSYLPSGNVLLIAWEYRSSPEAIAAGRDPSLLTNGQLWPERIVEVEPTGTLGGNIVWEWHVWDHLVQDFDINQGNYAPVASHPELVDINYIGSGPGGSDWLHVNAVDYHPGFDQILLSVHNTSEIWVIDHSTTTAEAASHSGGASGKGGDLLYRWGNPEAYRAGTATDRQLFVQHDAEWITAGLPGEGNILVFNNGGGRPGGNSSSVDELRPPVDITGVYSDPTPAYLPTSPLWTYATSPPGAFYATNISGSQRLPNGNTLIVDGPAGLFFEVLPDLTAVWEYVNPVIQSGPVTQGTAAAGAVFRADRYAADHPGLAGRDLTPITPVEQYPCAALPTVLFAVKSASDVALSWSPGCTVRYIRRTDVPWLATVAIPIAEHDGTTYQEPMPAEPEIYYFVE